MKIESHFLFALFDLCQRFRIGLSTLLAVLIHDVTVYHALPVSIVGDHCIRDIIRCGSTHRKEKGMVSRVM